MRPDTEAIILGCGTSGGVPAITGHWGKCDPNNPKNRRTRASIAVKNATTTLLFDTSPDLRHQFLREGLQKVDAVFYTHDHADHTHGIDDLRFLALTGGNRIPTYAAPETLAALEARFSYIFKQVRHYPPICDGRSLKVVTMIDDLEVHAFQQQHGEGHSYGFRVGDFAYSTDVNGLDDAAFDALTGVKIWVVDALRYDPHPTHAHLDMTLGWIERLKPEKAILTHLNVDMDYDMLSAQLPDGVCVAYDGMRLSIA